jgi:ABC-type transport system substrate-binding protein
MAVAIATVVATAGCGSGGGTNNAAGGDNDGTISIGSMFPPGTLDPTTGTQGSDLAYLNMVFDSLTQLNPSTAAVEPMLATSWKFVGADKLALDVQLRHGVVFQDGTPFNAQAVVDYSNAFIKAGDIANLLQYVTSVTASGPYEVVYHLSQQNANLPFGLSGRAGMIPSPTAVKKEGKNFALHPVGTGPYSFTSETQGASYSFTRFDKYWDDANVPRVKHVTFKIFQSDTALVNAIRSGNIQVAAHLASQDVKTLKPVSNLTVDTAPSTAFGLAYFNSARKPLTDSKVRLAFNLALDRKSIADAVTDGLGQPTDQAVPKGLPGYSASSEPIFTYDPAKAKDLMQQAGYGNGVNMTCDVYPGLGFDIAGPIIIAEEKAIGINLKLVTISPAQVGPFFDNKASAQCAFANYSGVGNPITAYQLIWSKAYYNAGKTDYGIDSYFDKFFSTYTSAGVNALTAQISAVEKTNPGYAPIFFAPLVNAFQNNIQGFVNSQLALNNLRGLHYKS